MLLAAILSASLTATAQPAIPVECGEWPQKPAWEWTEEERLERRCDERCLAARRMVAGQEGRRNGSCRSSGEIDDFVFGTDTPELFFPWQLYDALLSRIFVAERNFAMLQRRVFEDRVKENALDVPRQLWERLETASGEYLLLLRKQREMASHLDTAPSAEQRGLVVDIEESQRANCAARHAGLARARAEFGERDFDRLLYVAVAPGLCSSGKTDRSMLRWAGRGCPSH